MTTFLMHQGWDHQRRGRLTARAAQAIFLQRVVKYGSRKVGVVTRAQVVDSGRAVRLTVERTSAYHIADPKKLALGGLVDD